MWHSRWGVVDIRNKRGGGRGGVVCLVTGGQQAWTWNSPGTWLPLFPGAGCSIRGWSGGRMTYVCTVSCSRGYCSCVCCSFCGLIWFLLAVVGICVLIYWLLPQLIQIAVLQSATEQTCHLCPRLCLLVWCALFAKQPQFLTLLPSHHITHITWQEFNFSWPTVNISKKCIYKRLFLQFKLRDAAASSQGREH